MSPKLMAVIVSAFLVGAGGAYVMNTIERSSSSQTLKSTGKALIGGAFTMVNQKGKTVTEKDFLGRHSLVFFGFTHCPDICPATLQVASEAMEKLGPLADKVQPVFVSVDPERDTPEILKSYLEDFDPRLTGLTGSVDQVAKIAKAYRIYHNKVADPNSEGGYTVDHSAYLYLMSPEGQYIAHYPPAIQGDALADRMRPALSRG